MKYYSEFEEAVLEKYGLPPWFTHFDIIRYLTLDATAGPREGAPGGGRENLFFLENRKDISEKKKEI